MAREISAPNILEGVVKENIVTLNIGSNKIVANLAPPEGRLEERRRGAGDSEAR